MDDRLMARHGRFGQEVEELQRVHGPVQAAREADGESAAAPACAITALFTVAFVWLFLGLDGLVRGTVAVLLGPDYWFLGLCLVLRLVVPFAFLSDKVWDRRSQALADKAKVGRRPVDRALRWWMRGSVRTEHVFLTFVFVLIGTMSLGAAIYQVLFPEGSVAFEQPFVDFCRGLILTCLLLLFAALRGHLESRRSADA